MLLICDKNIEGEEAWLAARRPYVTATEAAVILGASDWSSKRVIAHEKRTGERPPVDPDAEERFWFGHALERVVLERIRYCTPPTHGVEPCGAVYASQEHPWMAASPDGFLVGEDGARVRGIEVKTTVSEPWPKLPEMYRIQVHHQGIVSNLRENSLYALHQGSKLREYVVEWDDALADRIVNETGEFHRQVKAGVEFEPSSYDLRAAQLAHPLREGIRTAIPHELVLAWQLAGEEAKAAEARKKALQAQMIEAMQGAQYANAGSLIVKRFIQNMPERRLPAMKIDRISVSKGAK